MSLPDAALVDHDSAPNHDARINLLMAVVTYRTGQRDRSLLAEGTDIGVQEQLDLSTHRRPTFQAGRVIELEIPHPVTFGTAIVGDDLDFGQGSRPCHQVDALCADYPEQKGIMVKRIAALKAMAWVKKGVIEHGTKEDFTEKDAPPPPFESPKFLGGRTGWTV